MTTTKPDDVVKPDGYVAWHPKHGYLKYKSISVQDRHIEYAEVHVTRSGAEFYAKGDIGDEEGWQILPVWLSTTPPMTEEALKVAAEKYCDNRFGKWNIHENDECWGIAYDAYLSCGRNRGAK